ncbi:unnamed protein product [Macrosiphum euphorbiae]|uniref:Uncharacterized protein n=1 Tax=Macrosiphum euphorbiae TaxID=13131 RepID=A0AAV0VXT9_9HEMI|nr:unnamed protein product [Macrosiphum euphorbiae]
MEYKSKVHITPISRDQTSKTILHAKPLYYILTLRLGTETETMDDEPSESPEFNSTSQISPPSSLLPPIFISLSVTSTNYVSRSKK